MKELPRALMFSFALEIFFFSVGNPDSKSSSGIQTLTNFVTKPSTTIASNHQTNHIENNDQGHLNIALMNFGDDQKHQYTHHHCRGFDMKAPYTLGHRQGPTL